MIEGVEDLKESGLAYPKIEDEEERIRQEADEAARRKREQEERDRLTKQKDQADMNN
jgi:hypothetical protein